jgi:hypothetical protein
MAYFAKLGSGNIVEKVISVNNAVITDSNGIEQEQLGIDFINKLYNTNDTWKKTSYNTNGGIHVKGGTPFRKNYAGIGFQYDLQRDAFLPPKPYNSWILNEDTCFWKAPVDVPTTELSENQYYSWNESILNWEIKELTQG